MRREHLPIDRLAIWSRLNNVDFNGIEARRLNGKGTGLVATWESDNGAILMNVPRDLVLSLENVWIYAKSDRHLLQVLEAVGEYSRTARGAILIFLLLQLTNSATQGRIGVLSPFSEYVQYLPEETSLPTFWTEPERSLLTGTSLEAALHAKLNNLDREFTLLREKTALIDWCKQHWWDAGQLTFDDWKQVDAMYRSRALDLPGTGHAVVPCIDMANHASGDETTALYDTDRDGNAVISLRIDKKVYPGDEVKITYGDDKGACEMLFSYGFIEDTMTAAKELFLDLDIPDDDPLKYAKRAISEVAPGFRLFLHSQSESTAWEGSFVWLICVNEEDGLDFKLLQVTDGETELQLSWKGQEILDFTKFPDLLKMEPYWEVFELRAISILQDRVFEQLQRLEGSKKHIEEICGLQEVEDVNYDNAMRLRDLEETLLLHALEDFEQKKFQRLQSPIVKAYLGGEMSKEPVELPEDDFS